MFIVDRDFDLGMVFFIRNSTMRFIERNKDCSINGLDLVIAPVAEENEKA